MGLLFGPRAGESADPVIGLALLRTALPYKARAWLGPSWSGEDKIGRRQRDSADHFN